jgi:uncharacterized small protein (TIGR04563 family)
VPKGETRRQALYFPELMLKELQHESQRLDRSISWLLQQAWRLAREKMKESEGIETFIDKN